jgi:hypothetical protein
MSRSGENQNHVDRGASFFEVTLFLPTDGDIDRLDAENKRILKRNIERAEKIFRAQTLPLPITNYQSKNTRRNSSSLSLSIGILDDVIRTTLMEDLPFVDESKIVPAANPLFMGFFVRYRLDNRSDKPDFKCDYAADLLGKYWYRDQENQPQDFFDAVMMAKEYMELKKAGDPNAEKIYSEKEPPSPPRRK